METVMYMVGYSESLREAIGNCGWGCGYVMIPKQTMMVQCFLNEFDRDENFFITIDNFTDAITFNEMKHINGTEYLVVGFDTMHGWNKPEHDFEWVFNKTLELKRCIDNMIN
jgi:hypothetical protein